MDQQIKVDTFIIFDALRCEDPLEEGFSTLDKAQDMCESFVQDNPELFKPIEYWLQESTTKWVAQPETYFEIHKITTTYTVS